MRASASAPVLPTVPTSATQWQHHGHTRWHYEHERSMLRTPEPQPFRARPSGRLHRPPTADADTTEEQRPETAPAPRPRSQSVVSDGSQRASAMRSASVPTGRRASLPTGRMLVRRDSMEVSINSAAASVAREEYERPPAVLVDDEKIFAPPTLARRRTILARDVLRMTTLSQKHLEVNLAPKPKMKLGGGGLSRLRGGLSGSLEKMKEERRAAAAAEYRQSRDEALAAIAERKHAVAVERLGRCIELSPNDDTLHRMRARYACARRGLAHVHVLVHVRPFHRQLRCPICRHSHPSRFGLATPPPPNPHPAHPTRPLTLSRAVFGAERSRSTATLPMRSRSPTPRWCSTSARRPTLCGKGGACT